MSNNHDDMDMANEEAEAGAGKSRVRFSGIVEADGREPSPVREDFGILTINQNERRWNALSRQVWLASRLVALFVFASFIIGLPLGNFIAHFDLYGTWSGWNPLSAFEFDTLIFAVIVPILLLLAGYLLSRAFTMLNAAESIAAVAQQFVTPDVTALRNVDNVGTVVRGHMTALNEGLDSALSQLASVEAMIRQHVEAIEVAGDAIEQKATGAVERVANERSRLMDLTESLNAHADSFAAAIAERANASIEALQTADTVSTRVESDFDDRLERLEDAAARALSSFESLRNALRDTDEGLRNTGQSIDAAAAETLKATERATAASNAAAESAARNAANVAASADRASEAAKKAAGDAIEIARSEAEMIAQSALDAASEQTDRVKDATAKALGDMAGATKQAVERARQDAAEATKAAAEVSRAAKLTGEAAEKASKDVTAASERARQSSEDALKFTETAASRIEQRNQALADARAALEKENERLETLIEEQRNRADRLADAIASQTERLSHLAEAQLREQEATAKIAEAQNEMERRAALEAEAAKQEQEAKAAEEKLRLDKERKAAADKQAKEAAAKQKAEKATARKKQQAQDELQLIGKDKTAKKQNGAARLEEMARDIAERRPPQRSKARKDPTIGDAQNSGGKRLKGDVSWREILDAADDAEPLELGAVAKKTSAEARDEAASAIRTISGLQDFTYELETRLYGDPPPALQERYDRGDRNVFANRLLRLNEADVKRRIRSESARDRKFETGVHGFLQNFESLLEDATTSETADEELEEYLSSPLGRVYLLIGATVGYFA